VFWQTRNVVALRIGVAISRTLGLRKPAIGCQPGSRQAQCTTGQVRPPLLLCVDSLLNHLLVIGSVRVRVRARARVSARVTVRDMDRI